MKNFINKYRIDLIGGGCVLAAATLMVICIFISDLMNTAPFLP